MECVKKTLDEVGLIGPFELSDPSVTLKVEQLVLNDIKSYKDRHVDTDVVKKIFSDEHLQARVADCFSTGLLLWRSNFFVKNDSSPQKTGWHHDRHFENGDKAIDINSIADHFSILIAITDIELDGGVIEYLPKSHLPLDFLPRDTRPFHLKTLQEHFTDLPDELHGCVKSIPLKRGQFVLFHSALLHHSKPFLGGGTRISMIGRLTTQSVEIPPSIAEPASVMAFN